MGKGGEKLNLKTNQISKIENGVYKDDLTKPYEKNGLTSKLAFAIIAAALGSGFQHGYNTGVVNNPQKILEEWISTTLGNRTSDNTSPDSSTVTLIWSISVSIFCVGGMLGGAITGLTANTLGRKGGLFWNNVIVFLAAVLHALAKSCKSFEMIIVGRFLIGVSSGLDAGLVPMYLAEISPVNLRGAVGTVYQLVITISILVSQLFGISAILGTKDGWPWLFAITAVPAIFQVCTLPLCPESPKYLLSTKGNELKAQKALAWFRGTLAVTQEMDEMKAENEASRQMPNVTIKELFSNRVLRIPLIISLTIMIAQQLSGINAVMFYSTEIFKMAGLKGDDATYATLGMGTINVAMTVVSLVLVEKAGRKTLLLVGFAGMTVVTLALTIAMIFTDDGPTPSAAAKSASVLCIIFVLTYVILFATGPGSIPWFLVAELFNQQARGPAASLAVCTNWTANFFVGLAFLPLKNLMKQYVFLIFVVLDFLFVIFIWKKVPETRNKTIDEISAHFRQQTYE